MGYKEKLRICEGILAIAILLFILLTIWISNNDSFGLGGFLLGFYGAIVLIPIIIFTVYYLLKSREKKINDGKIAVVSGILLLLSLPLYFGSQLHSFSTVDEVTKVVTYTPTTQFIDSSLEVLGVTSLFLMFPLGILTIIFFIKYLVSRKTEQ